MSARSDQFALENFEATFTWLERRARRIMMKRFNRRELAALAELRARNQQLKRDVDRTFPTPNVKRLMNADQR